MPTFNSTNGKIYFEQYGARANPPVLMIHGLSCQLIQWPKSFVQGIVDAGYRVVLFDNRDAGLSFELNAQVPTVTELIVAMNDPDSLKPVYTLLDMSQDAVELLDHIGQSGAHIVSMSMGGMIAQRLAMHNPSRVFSLTLLMSSTSNPKLPQATPEVVQAMSSNIGVTDRKQVIENTIAASRLLGGPFFDSRNYGIGRFVEEAYDRSFRPDGTARQLAAILIDGDRSVDLRKLTTPSLVIHGEEDPLIPKQASEDIAQNLPNARLYLIEKLGHDLPEPLIPTFVDHITKFLNSVDVSR